MKHILQIASVVLLLVIVSSLTFYLHPLWVNDQQIRLHLWHAGVKSRYIEAGGHRIHYFESFPPANGTDRPLVLIHGLGDHGESWSSLIPVLTANGFHVYAPDLPGYGRSDRPPDADYSISYEENSMVAFLGALHLNQADVAGWSMGGWIAMRLAADHPELVHRLVLYDSAGVYFPPRFAPDLFTPTDAAGLSRLLAVLSPHPRPMPNFVARDALRKLNRNAWVVSRSMAAMQAGRDLMDFRLHEIHQATLIVWGSHDDLLPLSSGERMHQGILQSNLAILDGCGHLAPAECRRPVLDATLAFLAANPPPAGTKRHLKP